MILLFLTNDNNSFFIDQLDNRILKYEVFLSFHILIIYFSEYCIKMSDVLYGVQNTTGIIKKHIFFLYYTFTQFMFNKSIFNHSKEQ